MQPVTAYTPHPNPQSLNSNSRDLGKDDAHAVNATPGGGNGRETSSGEVFIMNTIPSQGIGAVCIYEEKAPIPYGKSYSR